MIAKLKHLIRADVVGFFLVFTAASVLLLWNLGRNALANWDEAWYADATRFMFRYDHFLTPIWNGQYFFDKPPLQYWLTLPFLRVFGEAEVAYRLPSAFASIALVCLVYIWGVKRRGVRAGIIAAAILLTFPHFLDRSRSGNFDALFTMFTTASLALFVRKKPLIGGICLGLAWMTKGVFSGFFPVVVVTLFMIYEAIRFRSLRLFLPTIYFLLATVLVYAPWHILELNRFEQLIDTSYFSMIDQGTFGKWDWMSIVWRFDLKYLVFLWTFLRWWFPVLLTSSLWALARIDHEVHHKSSNIQSVIRQFLPFITFVVIFLALSAAREQNDWYIMPAYPFIALLISDFLLDLFKSNQRAIVVGVLIFGGVNVWWHHNQAFPPNTHLVEKQVAEFVKTHTSPDDLVVTAEYEFSTLRYYSEREVRTAARQPDFQGKYWWIWDNVDVETALRHGRSLVVITRPGAEWPVDVWGYHREKIGDVNGRTVSRVVSN